MGFFSKKSRDEALKIAESNLQKHAKVDAPKEEPPKAPPVEEQPPKGPSAEELQAETLRKELDTLTSKVAQKRESADSLDDIINTRQDLRKSIEEKLADVQKEYDGAVRNLMSTKKELNEKRRQTQSAENELENVQKRLTEIIADTSSAETIRKKKDDDLKSIEKRHNAVKAQIAEMDRAKNLLEEIKGEITIDQEKDARIKSHIAESEKILKKLEEEKKTVLENVRKAEKSLKGIEAGNSTAKQSAPAKESKSVVEAASAVVASMSQKLKSAENELVVLKSLLQKERHAHETTREKLAKFENPV